LIRSHKSMSQISKERCARYMEGHESGMGRVRCVCPFTYGRLTRDEHLHDASPFTYNMWDVLTQRGKREMVACLPLLALLADMRRSRE
jgi:hypothetical protein